MCYPVVRSQTRFALSLLITLFATVPRAEAQAAATDPCNAPATVNALAGLVAPLPTLDLSLPVQDQFIPGDGQFVQTFPLSIPTGRQGMAPELVVRYLTSGSNGPLGVGWTFELGAVELSRRPNVTADQPTGLDALVVRHFELRVDAVIRPRMVLRPVDPFHVEVHDRCHDRDPAGAGPVPFPLHITIVPSRPAFRVY